MEGIQTAVSDVPRLIESLGQLPEPVTKPAFVVVSGLPGTGKSYVCNKLAERSPFAVLESDKLRKTLFPSPSYSPAESSRLFQICHLIIGNLLKRGIPVILDATNLSERYREHLYNIADRLDAKLILVHVEAPPHLVYERLKSRKEEGESGNKSDAGWAVYQRMELTVQKILRNHYVVDTSHDITPVVAKIIRQIKH